MSEMGVYVSRAEVKATLGISEYQMQELVKAGTVTGVLLPGLKAKLYRRAQIDILANGSNGNGRKNHGEDKKT